MHCQIKNPPAEFSDRSQSCRRVDEDERKYVWGRTTEYLQLFGVNISSWCTYFELQTRHGNLSFGSSDWTLPSPPQRSAYLSPLTTGLFGHPQEGL